MAWHKFLVLGVVGSALAVGCTVTTGGDPEDNDSGGRGSGARSSGGRSGSGGAMTGGTSSGGSSGTTDSGAGGSTLPDGSAGSGGDFDAGPPMCDVEAGDEDCLACVKMNCCDQWWECNDDVCAGDGLDSGTGEGEANCIIGCMNDAQKMDPFISDITLSDCTDECIQGSIIGINTNELIACIRAPADDAGFTQVCSFECFGADL